MKTKLLSVTFLSFIIAVFGINLFSEEKLISVSERRDLSTFPTWNIDDVMSGAYSEDLKQYVNDQFFARDYFRNIQALSEYYLFGKNEINGVYYDGIELYDMFDTIDSNILAMHQDNINLIIDHFASKSSLMIIPSKANELDVEWLVDQNELADQFSSAIHAEYLNLFEVMDGENQYYQTDPHWKTSTALQVYNAFYSDNNHTYTYEMIDTAYMGSLLNKSGLPSIFFEDDLIIPHNNIIDSYQVTRVTGMDDSSQLEGPYQYHTVDSYEVFLGGNAPIITIENANGNGEHLLVFRDSFASSIAPFIAQDYSTVTLVDLRLVNINYIYQLFDQVEIELLFLYSLETLNDNYLLTNR